MPLLNDFLLGADPEFIVVEEGHIKQFTGRPEMNVPWGLDHSNWVIEPHPKPEFSVRKLIQNLKVSFNDFATVTPTGKWRAGAWIHAPERTITLGGHVHVDRPSCTKAQRDALDLFTQHLEGLDILPQTECVERRRSTYGHYGDIRTEHGHFEYRTMPSWLFSQRVTKLCLIGTKLIMVDPEAPRAVLGSALEPSSKKLQAFFERFRHKDDDVDWILGAGMLGKKLSVKPDRDLRNVWKVQPVKEDPHWKEEKAREDAARAERETPTVMSPTVFEIEGLYMSFTNNPTRVPTTEERAELRQAVRDRGTPLQVGSWQPFPTGDRGSHVTIWGRSGRQWDPHIRCNTIRTGVQGTRYVWRVPQGQIINERVRNILRVRVAEGGADRPGSLVLYDGLLFQPCGPEGWTNEQE